MKYVVKRIFDMGEVDSSGARIIHQIGGEYQGASAKELLESGLIEEVASNDAAPSEPAEVEIASETQVEKILSKVADDSKLKKKKRKDR